MFAFSFPASAKVYIDISAPTAKRLPIAIQEINAQEGESATVASKITEVIINDLDITGIFSIIDKGSYPDDPLKTELSPEKIDFKPWADTGAEALVKGKLSVKGRNLTVAVRLYDVTTDKQVMAYKYVKDVKDVRNVAHMIADDIITTLTGEKGVFGTKIAFVSSNKGNKEIFLMDYDGEGVEAVTRNGSINLSPALSPDGSALSYVSFKDERPSVYIRELKDGKEKRLSAPGGVSLGVSWSPDGQKLAIVISKEGNADIYLTDRKGSEFTRLTSGWGLDVSPAWSPNGKEIAFVSDRGGSPQIYIMDSSGGDAKRVTYEGKYNASPAWAPKGDKIAFAGMNDGRFDIFTINPDGSGLLQLTADAGDNETPTYSPDGRFISFSSTRDGSPAVYIMKSDGTEQRRASPINETATAPRWGPRTKR